MEGLPEGFHQFLQEQRIPAQIYQQYQHQHQHTELLKTPRQRASVPQRYFTWNTDSGTSAEPSVEELERDLGTRVTRVPWCPRFWMVDGKTRLASSAFQKSAQLLCMDVSSAVAVYALGVEPQDHVLDLCCAPGAKLTLMSMLLGGNSQPPSQDLMGSVTGVDIARHRLSTCRSLIKKYRLNRVRLFLGDGTTFSVSAPPSNAILMRKHAIAPPHEMKFDQEDAKPFHAPRLFQHIPKILPPLLYDKVLVDAECTHDGSIAHLLKYTQNDAPCVPEAGKSSWHHAQYDAERHLSAERVQEIQQLQRALLVRGWEMLKHGGSLVYSTCSFSRGQNEHILAWFLLHQQMDGNVKLQPLEDDAYVTYSALFPSKEETSSTNDSELDPSLVLEFGRERVESVYHAIAQHRLRLHGYYDGFWTSGLFIIKLTKC